jgi:hypothetical protein
LLHQLASLLHHSNYTTHVNQLIPAKQLIEHEANVNASSTPTRTTPLHIACSSSVVTNLDLIELLLEEGADPNAQMKLGMTPLMCTRKLAPGAAKFLLSWPTTDVNICTISEESFQITVRLAIAALSEQIARRDNPEQVQHDFLLQQWRDIEGMLVGRLAPDT